MSLIRQRIKETLNVDDAAKQMVVCATAYDLIFGTPKVADSVKRTAIQHIIYWEVYNCIYPIQYGPMVIAWMKPYPTSFFGNVETNQLVLDTFKEHYKQSEKLTRKLIYGEEDNVVQLAPGIQLQ